MERFKKDEHGNSVESTLKMTHLVCDQLRFDRLGFQSSAETRYEFSYGIAKDEDGAYRAQLTINASRKDEFDAKVQITGYFSIDEDDPQKDTLLQRNALAILFPFARSQMTLLTSQPETTPVIIPVVNINRFMESAEQQEP